MKRFNVLSCALGLALAFTGCGDDDTGPADTGPRPDTGMVDGGGTDGPVECVMADEENTRELCNDGCDNDGNGFMDCGPLGDFECMNTPGACVDACPTMGPENTMEACTDGCDNDGNGFVDCRDFACAAFCPVENSNVTCSDGISNDGDRFVDCEDLDCLNTMNDPPTGVNVCLREMTNAACSDGMDNDGDGMTDCEDDSCQGDGIVVCDGATATGAMEAQWPAMIAARCENDMDDDGNGFIDCGDFTCLYFHAPCRALPPEAGNGLCSDGMDNDGDGLTDCADPDCSPERAEGIVVCDAEGEPVEFADAAAVTAAANARCSDGDGNGNDFIDCADFGCSQDESVTVCLEGRLSTCSDGVDNDGNGFTDCDDNACSRNLNPAVCADSEKGLENCSNGVYDGPPPGEDERVFVDCANRSCQSLSVCSGRRPMM